ncbi:MAG: thioredoxin family protein [Saprospiraceae bacterium]|nr:thioredoxin family protein [Saprospiraceae bacterium]
MNISKIAVNFLVVFTLMATCVNTIDANNRTTVNFSDVNVDEAIAKASEEGKLVLLDFYASWCTPCKWMEQTTFTDQRVTSTLNSNYVAIKVNIDDVEGFQMKNKYQVNFLPTILILSSEGKMVERIEQTMVADELLGILELHNSPENKVVIKHDFNKSPKRINGSKDVEEEDPWTISQDDYRRYSEMEDKRNYRVQVGVFDDYSDAQKEVNKLRDIFMEPIVVLNDFRNDKVLFKIMLGQFQTMSEASSFCKILKTNFSINAIVN